MDVAAFGADPADLEFVLLLAGLLVGQDQHLHQGGQCVSAGHLPEIVFLQLGLDHLLALSGSAGEVAQAHARRLDHMQLVPLLRGVASQDHRGPERPHRPVQGVRIDEQAQSLGHDSSGHRQVE